MANPFRDMSVIMQALVAAAVAVVLVLVGVYVPGSPIARERDEVDSAVQKKTKLNQEVTQLQVYKQRYGELKQQMDALSKQLDTLKTIVPEEKETDEFIRLLQGAEHARGATRRAGAPGHPGHGRRELSVRRQPPHERARAPQRRAGRRPRRTRQRPKVPNPPRPLASPRNSRPSPQHQPRPNPQ